MKIKSAISILLIISMLSTLFITSVYANEPEDVMDTNSIFKIEVVDGELVFYTFEPYSENSMIAMGEPGRCPSKPKVTYNHMTRSELIEYRDRFNSGKDVFNLIAGFILGIVHPALGGAYALGTLGSNYYYDIIVKALDKGKDNYTIKTTYGCREVRQGSRGYVRTFTVRSVEIY